MLSFLVALTPAAGDRYSLGGKLSFIQTYRLAESPIPSRVR